MLSTTIKMMAAILILLTMSLQGSALYLPWFEPKDCQPIDAEYAKTLNLSVHTDFHFVRDNTRLTSTDHHEGFVISPSPWPSAKKSTKVRNGGRDAGKSNLIKLLLHQRPNSNDPDETFWFWLDRYAACTYRGLPYKTIKGGYVHTM